MNLLKKFTTQNPPSGKLALNIKSNQARNLVGAWPATDEKGNLARDYGPHKSHGTKVNNPTHYQHPTVGGMQRFVRASGQYVTIPWNTSTIGMQDFFGSCWVIVNEHNAVDEATIFSHWHALSLKREWRLECSTAGNITITNNVGGAIVGSYLTPGELYHIMFGWQGGAWLFLGINGVWLWGNSKGRTQVLGDGNLVIGGRESSPVDQFFDGWIGDVRLHSYIKFEAEAWALYDTKTRHQMWMPVASLQPPIWFLTSTTLVVDNLSQTNTVSKIDTTKESTLAVDNLSQANNASKLTLTSIHNLSLQDISQANAIDHIGITKESDLVVDDLAQSNTVDKLNIVQLHILQAVSDLSQTNIVTKPLLQAEGYVAVYSISQTNTIEKIDTTKETALAVHNLAQANLVDKINMTGETNLFPQDLSQANIVSHVGELSQYSDLLIRNLFQTNDTDHISITQVHNITDVLDISQSNTIDKVGIWASNQIMVYDLSQTNLLTGVTVTQVHNLGVRNLSQANAMFIITLWDWWHEVIDEVGLVSLSYSMVGYIEQSYEEYGFIDMELDEITYIDQSLEESGEIAQEHGQDVMIAMTHEQDGEL